MRTSNRLPRAAFIRKSWSKAESAADGLPVGDVVGVIGVIGLGLVITTGAVPSCRSDDSHALTVMASILSAIKNAVLPLLVVIQSPPPPNWVQVKTDYEQALLR